VHMNVDMSAGFEGFVCHVHSYNCILDSFCLCSCFFVCQWLFIFLLMNHK
jgi:hypothetical protein